MRNVYVVAHAQSMHHVEKLGGGWYDTSLSELGRTQAEKTGHYLKSIIESDVKILSSDLKRAAETAEIIAGILGREVTLDKGFREMSYGEIEGQPQEWIKTLKAQVPQDRERMDHRAFKGAESRREVGTRVKDALNRALGHSDSDLVIVTHGFATTFLIMAWLRVPVEYMGYGNFPSKPGCVSHLQEDDTFKNRGIKFLCYSEHLES